jgi:hypothetical protein
MREEDMVGLSINPLPGDPLSFLSVLPDLFLLWIFCDRFFVAVHADTYAGHSRKGLGFEEAVTGVTL